MSGHKKILKQEIDIPNRPDLKMRVEDWIDTPSLKEAIFYGLRKQVYRNIVSVYNGKGQYMGGSEWLTFFLRHGISPEWVEMGGHRVSIGFSEFEQKWYGWSHRAYCGFKIGDTVKEGDCTNSPGSIPEYIAEHPEADLSLPVGFRAESLDDARRMAIAFAESVS